VNNQDLKTEVEIVSKIIKTVSRKLDIPAMSIVEKKRLRLPAHNARAIVFKVLSDYVHHSHVAEAFGLSDEAVRQQNIRTDTLMADDLKYFDAFCLTACEHERDLKRLRDLVEEPKAPSIRRDKKIETMFD
jgi:hypothetical protein